MAPERSQTQLKPVGIYFEHPNWFQPLFDEMERRQIPFRKLSAARHTFDPGQRSSEFSLIVNRMSPSAFVRGNRHAIAYTINYLAHLKSIQAAVLNGYDAYLFEFSKARQIELFEELGVRYPRTRIINHASQAHLAARGMQFPVVVKPNIGGSGAGIVRFDDPDALQVHADAGHIDLGIDQTALVQEYLPPRGNQIVRVEVLEGRFLYAIRLELGNTFNLCPADYCDPEQVVFGNRQPEVQAIQPAAEVIETVLKITRRAGFDLGGVEYLVNDRDGQVYYYDLNALSNFVANAQEIVGFDPFVNLVDLIERRSGIPARR